MAGTFAAAHRTVKHRAVDREFRDFAGDMQALSINCLYAAAGGARRRSRRGGETR